MTLEGPDKRGNSIANDPSTSVLNREIYYERKLMASHREVCRNPRCACGAWTGPEPEPVPVADYYNRRGYGEAMLGRAEVDQRA